MITWAGALAIGFSSVGTLGKWSSESIEEVAGGPVEAIQASGGGWLSGVRWGDLLAVQFRNWQNVSAVLIMVVVMVLVIDGVSGAVRRRILAGSDRTGADANMETIENMGGFLTRRRRPKT